MMRQMRDATKPIMIVAAIAFVALMVFEWGADITGQSAGGLGDVGSVNGRKVSYDEYILTYQSLYQQAQAVQEEPIHSQQNRELEDQAWEEIVITILIEQELERRGITVTDEEIARLAPIAPPPQLAAAPAFQDADGNFDISLYRNWLRVAPPQELLQVEELYRSILPRETLYRQLQVGNFIPDAELWRSYRDANEQVTVRYLALDPRSRYREAEAQPTEEAIRAYYAEKRDDFMIPAEVELRAVVIDKSLTAADSAAVETLADSLREEILGGGDFAEIAGARSVDEGSAAAGGDLGTFPQGTMVAPFDSAVFAAPVGQTVGPVRSDFGLHLIEVTDRWGTDSVSARHILLAFELSEDREFALLELADSLEDLAEEVSLGDAALQTGLTASEVTMRENFRFITGVGQAWEGSDWAFEEAEPGDVSPVFETDLAFYALELVERRAERFLTLEQARAAISATLLFELQMELARDEAAGLLDRIVQGEALESVAEEAGIELAEAGPFTRDDNVPGLGRWNEATGTAFGLRPGELSEVVSTPASVYLIEQMSFVPADSAAWLNQLPIQRSIENTVAQQTAWSDWLNALRASADVVDRRAQVIQALEEQSEQQPAMPPIFE